MFVGFMERTMRSYNTFRVFVLGSQTELGKLMGLFKDRECTTYLFSGMSIFYPIVKN